MSSEAPTATCASRMARLGNGAVTPPRGDLYRADEREARLPLEAWHARVASLDTRGFGVAFDPGLDSMTPLEDSGFDSLEALT